VKLSDKKMRATDNEATRENVAGSFGDELG